MRRFRSFRRDKHGVCSAWAVRVIRAVTDVGRQDAVQWASLRTGVGTPLSRNFLSIRLRIGYASAAVCLARPIFVHDRSSAHETIGFTRTRTRAFSLLLLASCCPACVAHARRLSFTWPIASRRPRVGACTARLAAPTCRVFYLGCHYLLWPAWYKIWSNNLRQHDLQADTVTSSTRWTSRVL